MAKYKIIPSSRTIVQSPISIGHKAEKGVEAIEFDLTAWVETYGSGTLTVIMRRWGDAIPYPIALEIDENNKATWTLSDIDTAKAGMAYAQLSYVVGDEVVKKSDIYTFRVMDSLTGEGEPPEAYESWLEHLTHLAAEAMAEVLDIEGIVTDKTLTVDGGIADAKATGDALSALEDAVTEETDKLKADLDDKVDLPSNGYGTSGKVLRSTGTGTEWTAVGQPTDAQTAEAVSDWLDKHPEATTTVQDGSITPAKFALNAISIDTWSGSSSINNWNGNTLEDKLCDFLENATNGAKLDLQGQKITITKRFIKTTYTFLNNTIISNGIIEIPSSLGGWLSIGSSGGHRVPIFNNCVFVCNDANSSGQIFNGSSYNFKAIGCVFYNIQIASSGYVQACELIGCNVMNRNSYLIECDYAVAVTMTECSFEAGNVGVFNGNGDSNRASLTYGSFSNCIFEGFLEAVFRTHGITSVGFNSCYVEGVPYLIYDTDEYVNSFYVYINGGIIDNSSSTNDYTIYSNISYPSLLINNLNYSRQGNQYLSNFANRRKQITSSNYIDTYLYGANDGANEIIKTNHTFSGTSFAFSTNRTNMTSQPQAFLVTIAKYVNNTYLYTRVSILTLNYRASTGYKVTETPLVSNSSMNDNDTITWTATADNVLGLVTINGESNVSLYLSVVNLGATMSGMVL